MSNKITAIIPIRKGSTRVPNKNFKDFENGMSLLELKIKSLKNVSIIDEIVINTDSDKAINISKEHGVSHFRRDDYFASSYVSQSEFFYNLAETTNTDIIMYVPCTSPFISTETYYNVINIYRSNKYDSVNTVNLIKDFLWLNNKPLNYTLDNAPNSQDLPNIFKLNFGVNILSKSVMLSQKNIVGNSPFFYLLSDVEGVDIDYQSDFEYAKFINKTKL